MTTALDDDVSRFGQPLGRGEGTHDASREEKEGRKQHADWGSSAVSTGPTARPGIKTHTKDGTRLMVGGREAGRRETRGRVVD